VQTLGVGILCFCCIFFRLLNTAVDELSTKISMGHCCERLVISTLQEFYQITYPYCKHVDLQPLCTANLLDTCSHNWTSENSTENQHRDSKTTTRNNTGTENETTQKQSDIMQMSSDIMNFCNQSTDVEETGCHVIHAYDTCLLPLAGQTIVDCR